MEENKVCLILELNSAGFKNRQIAKQLGIHHRTVSYWLNKNGRKSPFANEPLDKVSDTEARCKKCKEIKLLSEFQKNRKNQKYEYRFSYCNSCRRKQCYLNINSDINKFLSDKYNRTKLRAAKINIPFSISKEEFISQFEKQKGLCFYTDIEMTWGVGYGKSRDAISVDKIVPEIGYVSGNVVFCSDRINTCKSDLALEEIKHWMPEWYRRIESIIFTE